MIERVQPYLDRFRGKVGQIATVGALTLGLVGCSSGDAQEEAPALDPAISVEANAAPVDTYSNISADGLTQSIAEQPDNLERYEYLENINPATGKDTLDFPSKESAALLTITLDNASKKLIFEDATPGLTDDESKLLSSVQANAPLLEAAMASDRLDSIRFRIMRPTDPAYDISGEVPRAIPFYLSKDFSQGETDQSNIYYFLPPSGTMDLKTVTTMTRHEGLHAALGHGPLVKPSPEITKRYQQACSVLRQDAIETMQLMGGTANYALYQLGTQAPRSLQPAYETVIEAIENGTYDQLPWFTEDTDATIPECFVQPPHAAVVKQAELLGVSEDMDKFLTENRDKPEFDTLLGTIYDSWNDSLEDLTVYQIYKEGMWLATADSEDAGHPQDNWREMATSSMNRLYGDIDGLAQDLQHLKPEVRTAALEILDVTKELLEAAYADNKDDADFIKELRGKHAALHKALAD